MRTIRLILATIAALTLLGAGAWAGMFVAHWKPASGATVNTAEIRDVTLGAITSAAEVRARQGVLARVTVRATPGGALGAVGVTAEHTVLAAGEVTAAVTLPSDPARAVAVAPDGSVTVTLPGPVLTATVDPAASEVFGSGWAALIGADRLAALQQADSTARATMIQAAGPAVAALARETAIDTYSRLLRVAGVSQVAVVVGE